MAVCLITNVHGATLQQYDDVRSALGEPLGAGQLSHIAGATTDGVCIVDIWETRAGGKTARVVKVDDRHLILLLEFGSRENAGRIARDLGVPWMRENIVPLLERDSERSVGEVLAAAMA